MKFINFVKIALLMLLTISEAALSKSIGDVENENDDSLNKKTFNLPNLKIDISLTDTINKDQNKMENKNSISEKGKSEYNHNNQKKIIYQMQTA